MVKWKAHTLSDLYINDPAQIVIYVTESCADCVRVKKFLEARNIPHVRVGLEGDDQATEFVVRINRGYRSVPTIVFPDGSVLVEPGWDELNNKFSGSYSSGWCGNKVSEPPTGGLCSKTQAGYNKMEERR